MTGKGFLNSKHTWLVWVISEMEMIETKTSKSGVQTIIFSTNKINKKF